MHYKRVIPCLDVDRGRVVKGVGFVDLRDAGDPVELAARYDAASDELSGVPPPEKPAPPRRVRRFRRQTRLRAFTRR